MVTIRKIIQIFTIISLIWLILTFIAFLTIPSSPSPLLRGSTFVLSTENSLSFPIAPASTYCHSWSRSQEKFFWSDLSSAYSVKKLKDFGWTHLPSRSSGLGLSLLPGTELNYTKLKWTKLFNIEEEENFQLFLIPKEANFIFTRMYVFKDSEGNNMQTARLGVDYACNTQLFNHVPGASAFCRKDYLQMYLNDYTQRYSKLGLSHCYSPITPRSFLLSNPSNCQDFIKILRELISTYNETSMPVEWISKSALKHKGYGIEILDYQLVQYFLTLYTSEIADCNNILKSHEHIIIQKYITNPALIENRKFDFRVFVLCINADPLIVAWAPDNGHTRLSDKAYDELSKDFTTHITANVASESPKSFEFLKKHRYNLREIGEYFKGKIGNVDKWLKEIAYPKVKSILIHMFRSTQQNFLVKRAGLFEFYGVDFIMDDTLENFYLLESNRRPDVQEKNPDLQYREDMILEDLSEVADYFLENGVRLTKSKDLFHRFKAFKPLIDETEADPYFGLLSNECSIQFKDMNEKLPIDPMIEPLKSYIDSNLSI